MTVRRPKRVGHQPAGATRAECFVAWLATALPQKIAAAPERVLINFACVLIGASALLAEKPRSLLALWPTGAVTTWSLTMAFGGAAALLGYWNYPQRLWARPMERLGYLTLLLATSVYGIGLIIVFGWQGMFTGVIFLGIAFSKAIRLLVTSAYRSHLLRNDGGEDGN